MATVNTSLPHEQRTAAEPRANRLEPVVVANIREINDSIRLLRLHAADPEHTIKFSPGQWVDTHIPDLRQAGGFTITSTPSEAKPSSHSPPYIELAVQKSSNPPAQWFWRPSDELLGSKLVVRAGGSFVWPPPNLNPNDVERLVLIAGGVGINPLISIFSHLIRSFTRPREVHFIYGTKAGPDLDPQRILFLPRLIDMIAAADDANVTLSVFLTGTGLDGRIEHGKLPNRTFARRMSQADLTQALDGYDGHSNENSRSGTLCYVCGPSKFTDEMVQFLARQPGMSEDRVLCEKWW